MRTLDRLDAFARSRPPTAGAVNPTPAPSTSFVERMDDDLDTPAVAAAIFDLVRRANAAADAGDEPTANRPPASVFTITEALGLSLNTAIDDVDEPTAALVAARNLARLGEELGRGRPAAGRTRRPRLDRGGWARRHHCSSLRLNG